MKYQLALLLIVIAFVPLTRAHAQTSNVSIVDFAFAPNSITVTTGSTVVWTNTGMMPHTATADQGSFDSGTMMPGQQYSHMFMTPGTYAYHCNFHSNMRGTIVVTGSSPRPNPNPYPQPYPQPQQNYPQLYWCGTYYSYYPCQNQVYNSSNNYNVNNNYNYNPNRYSYYPFYYYSYPSYSYPSYQYYYPSSYYVYPSYLYSYPVSYYYSNGYGY